MPGDDRMTKPFSSKLVGLRNTRDLRAEMLDLARRLATNQDEGRLLVEAPLVSVATIQAEWDAALAVLAPAIRRRMHLTIEQRRSHADRSLQLRDPGIHPLDRPNHRYEVLRELAKASLAGDGSQSVRQLAECIGVSQPTVRAALAELGQTGLCRRRGARYELAAEEVSVERQARARALPQMLRFRFRQGSYPRPPAELVERAMLLLGPEGPPESAPYALSGVHVALTSVPRVDLMGTPRLDLVAYVPGKDRSIDVREMLRRLDHGLEFEPSVVAPAPVVVSLVRAATGSEHHRVIDHVRCADPADVFLSLIDADLVEQAHQFAEGVRTEEA